MTNKTDDDIAKIGRLLQLAKAHDVKELDAELPFYTTSQHHGIMRVKAKWNHGPSS